MDTHETIKALLKELISEDEILYAIRAVVSERIDRHLHEEIRNLVNEAIRDRSDDYIKSAVQKVIDGMVRVDDGWGNRAETTAVGANMLASGAQKTEHINSEIRRVIV